jgi:hypothetical protein
MGPDGCTLFDSEMSKCWFAETIKKFNRDVLITYSASAPEIVVARWNDVRALRPPDGDAGWLEIKGQYECETEGHYRPDTWVLMTPGPNRRAALIHRHGFQ